MTRVSGGFDIGGELPTGTTILEASAGTGKTFTIAALATRYVAEGLAELHELMVVTFGRAATRELRERVRERVVDTERELADPAAARTSQDDLLRHLTTGVPDEEVALRRKRLTAALADFDAATIATTHGFCQQMLTGLGIAGDFEPDGTFVESVDDLVDEVVDDLYLRKYGVPDGPKPPPMSYAEARSVVVRAISDRHAALVPARAEPGSVPALRFGIATAARAEVDRRKRQRRLKDYDDLLTRLRDALVDVANGPAARQRIRDRYKVVLVDEFQDTDPVQWEILRTAFHGHTTLVLIGDPKQAIYAFRGGDVVTYLAAAVDATSASTLVRNWRSDQALLLALEQIFAGAALGHDGIVVRPVEAEHTSRRLSGAPVDAALRLRVVRRDHVGGSPKPKVDRVRDLVTADVAADIARLLGGAPLLTFDDGPRPLGPGDIAVLVHTNKQATAAHAALLATGVPAVLTGAVNVFSTDMASEWLVLLQALEQPHRATRVRTAALGCFVGWSATRLAEAEDAVMDELGPRLREWGEALARRGVPALLELVLQAGLPERLLATPTGERQLTDLRHLAEALHAVARAEGLGTAALVEWLQHRIADAVGDVSEERTRRLESDADAVQVVTVHRSKGLEFPVVYVPFGWDRFVKGTPDLLRFHDEAGIRTADVGGKTGAAYDQNKALDQAEDAGESLRLLYVAFTRAQCQVVTWWGPSTNTPRSAMHRLLFADHAVGEQPADQPALPSDDAARDRLDALAAASAGIIVVEDVDVGGSTRWRPPADTAPVLSAATFDRRLDTAWRRTSYSALTAAAHGDVPADGGVMSEPEGRVLEDEVQVPAPAASPPARGDADETMRDALSPLRALPRGTAFGIVVHAVLETVDTGAPDLLTELVGRCRDVVGRRTGSSLDADAMAAALLPPMLTPLGPMAGQLSLAQVRPEDRLVELDFELPLAGGDDPRAGAATVGALADVLRRHLPADDPFATYPDLLSAPGLAGEKLRGYLVGSLDAVLRVRGDGEPRYLVADYKTNWLGGATAENLSAWHYRAGALTGAMLDAHYPLQLLLYLVALHRYLRWRQPGYDPDVHLGGGLYLFVRGMCGPTTPTADGTPCGVFGWRPPGELVEALSRLLAGDGA
ncbi:MAG: UvrD-helicase domain-containing protein [Nocardioidaceae bacterium]